LKFFSGRQHHFARGFALRNGTMRLRSLFQGVGFPHDYFQLPFSKVLDELRVSPA
jgi:hypothetical protein